MPKAQKVGRTKISTTVSSETYRFLNHKVRSGEASNLAEAIDRSIHRVRQLENRERLARATAKYYEDLDAPSTKEENALARDLAAVGEDFDFDCEF